MKRTDLEAELVKLGWQNAGPASDSRYSKWVRPGSKADPIFVPTQDLILDITADSIIGKATRR